MKQLYRIITVFLLAIFWADVAYAQYEVAIEDELLQDTCLSYLTGLWYYNLGDEEFKEPSHDIASKMYFEMAVRSFEQHEKEHPQHDYTNLFLGQSYYYLALLESHITTGGPEYNKKVNEYAQNALQHLPQDNTIMRFICYAISGLCFVDEQNDHDASNAFQEALNYNLDFSSNPILLYFYKWSLYQHSYLCYSSYLNNISYSINKCGSIQETPTLDTCSGDQQLEHCIDDLNRLVGIEQNGSDDHQIDSSALVLLGNCYYYKGEYEQAKRCYEKSGNLLLYDEIKNRDNFVNHFNQGILLYYGDSLNGVEPDTCIAFQEFEKAIECDVNYKKHPAFIPYYKNVLFQHAAILFDSYRFNIPDTTNNCDPIKEIPEWATCVGDHQLDRCIDDLNHIVTLDQAESEINSIDTTALALLGECHYYKKEYKEATECYEKSGIASDQLDILPAFIFWDSYNQQGLIESEQAKVLLETIIEKWRNDPTYYRSLYLDDANYENSVGEMSELAHSLMGYYIDKEEYDKAFDFWIKIKNNFSLDTTLIYYEGICRYNLGDPTAIEQMEFAIRMNPTSSKLHSGYLAMQMMQGKFSSKTPLENAGFAPKQNDTTYYMLKGLACYYEKDYTAAKENYDGVYNLDPSPENALMLAFCYQKIVETKSHPETRQLDSIYARKYFQEVVSKEERIGKYCYAPYAYCYLNDYDKAAEIMEDILNTELVSPAISEQDKETCHDIHYRAAEIYASVGNKKKAKKHFKKALEYQHDPLTLALAEKAPLLTSIHKYVEKEVGRYKKHQSITVSPIHRDTLFCDIPFEKNGNYNTKTINCKINGKTVNNMLFDPGADYIQLTSQWAFDSIGIVDEDIIGCLSPKDANGKKSGLQLVSLKTVEFGDIVLENVQALINPNTKAPLLLGCTVLNNLKVETPSPVNKGMIRLTYIKESIEISEDKKNTDNQQGE